jgi:hypothetical protein
MVLMRMKSAGGIKHLTLPVGTLNNADRGAV